MFLWELCEYYLVHVRRPMLYFFKRLGRESMCCWSGQSGLLQSQLEFIRLCLPRCGDIGSLYISPLASTWTWLFPVHQLNHHCCITFRHFVIHTFGLDMFEMCNITLERTVEAWQPLWLYHPAANRNKEPSLYVNSHTRISWSTFSYFVFANLNGLLQKSVG